MVETPEAKTWKVVDVQSRNPPSESTEYDTRWVGIVLWAAANALDHLCAVNRLLCRPTYEFLLSQLKMP